mmetsp:Transcript_131040/g.293126  ORF Transcript_131040/g.293126 Transcript_131040/m.293126 type:complete len:153 (+) Transcript_131040:94-552(+)
MARHCRSSLAAVLVLDSLLLGAWCLSSAFVSPPRAVDARTLAAGGAAAVTALTQLPAGAQALTVEKWVYKDPEGDLTPEQILFFLGFFLIHAAGVADFYAKKTGAGPAVPFNPFRAQQFWDPESGSKKPLFGYGQGEFDKGRTGYGDFFSKR